MNNFDDCLQTIYAVSLMGASWMVHSWALVYPWLTGLTGLLAFIIAAHSIARLIYRWARGINTISGDEL